MLRVALYLTATHSACRNSFPEECTSLEIGIVYLFLYCVTWLASFFSSFPTWSLCLPRQDRGSLRINCLLIPYLISKQVRVNTFKSSYFLSNLQASETQRFLARSSRQAAQTSTHKHTSNLMIKSVGRPALLLPQVLLCFIYSFLSKGYIVMLWTILDLD